MSRLELDDGTDGNGCLFVDGPDAESLQAFLDDADPMWDRCEMP